MPIFRNFWSNNDIRKGYLSSLNGHIRFETPSTKKDLTLKIQEFHPRSISKFDARPTNLLNSFNRTSLNIPKSNSRLNNFKKSSRCLIKNSRYYNEDFVTKETPIYNNSIGEKKESISNLKIRIPIHPLKIGVIGYKFKKYFKGHGWFEGRVSKINIGTKEKKDRRVIYSDGDVEDISIKQLKSLKRVTQYLSPIKSHYKPNISSPVEKIEKVETPKSLHTVKYSLFTPRKVFVTDNFNKANSISEMESNIDTDNENILFIGNDEIDSSYTEKYREENLNTLICTGQKEISLNKNSENKGIGKINVLKSE